MAKNKNQGTHSAKRTQTTPKHEVAKEMVVEPQAPAPIPFLKKITIGYLPYLITFLLCVLLYANTFRHQFALDDDIVICKNEYVLQGISGIKSIFSKDLYDSFYKQMNTRDQLSGGRYRPLSVATFAIEQEFIGTQENPVYSANCWDANQNGVGDAAEDLTGDGIFNDKDCRVKGFGLRHINNVLFYGLTCCVLFFFLSSVVFKNNKLLALAVTLLFAAHPMHTEVVANVKSRDEIFSLLFMLLTLISAHRYIQRGKMTDMLISALCFLAAMLSKEYGATLLILVPLSLYIFEPERIKLNGIVKVALSYLGVFLIYFLMRRNAVAVIGKSDLQDTELLNNPFLLADESQKVATKLFIFLKYIITLIIPHPLSSDYGYNSIPYRNFGDIEVWIGVLSIIAIVFGGIWALKKRNWIAFALAFYMLNILLVTNLVFNVGATMGERLAFHSSVGFCMLLGAFLFWIGDKVKQVALPLGMMVLIVIAYGFKTIDRNKAWESDVTLALTDVEIMPESTSLNGNAASRYIDLSEYKANKPKEKEYLQKSIRYGLKALSLHPQFVNGYLNLGLAYAKLEQFDSAKVTWDKAFKIYPSHPQKQTFYGLLGQAYYNKGYNLGGAGKWKEGQFYLFKATEVAPENARYWYDLGGFSYNAGDFATAKMAWAKAYQLNPKDTAIQKVQGIFK